MAIDPDTVRTATLPCARVDGDVPGDRGHLLAATTARDADPGSHGLDRHPSRPWRP